MVSCSCSTCGVDTEVVAVLLAGGLTMVELFFTEVLVVTEVEVLVLFVCWLELPAVFDVTVPALKPETTSSLLTKSLCVLKISEPNVSSVLVAGLLLNTGF